MLDLYGKTNVPIKQKEYSGATTDTAKVTVNNQSNVISVDVNLDNIKDYINNYINSLLNKGA